MIIENGARTLTKQAVSKIEWRKFPVSWGALLIAVVFVAFALALLFTKRPWVDEAWFTSPALDLVTHGRFGTLLLDPAGSHLRLYKADAFLRGINEHTYWVMPIHLLQLAAWGKVFGFSIFSMRMPSVLWGGIALASIGWMVRRLYEGRGAALVAAAVLAVDFGFLNGASDARMDMTCVALGLAALAVYLGLREVNFLRAVISAHVLAAAAVFTHPNGIFASAGLLLTMLWLDRHRIRPLAVALVAAPYVILGLLWAIYCLQAPVDFAAQFSANSAARANDVLAPWRGVWREINGRFRNHFWPESSIGKLKIVGILIYLAALGTLACARKLRQASGCRLLLCLTILQFLCLSVFATIKVAYYIIYILPYFAAVTGIAISHLWSSYGTRARALCATALVIYLAVQTAAVINLSVATRGYQKEYKPVIAYLKSTLQPDDLVMGSAELGFSLGFENPQLVDDVWFGYWSGRRPTVLVVDRWYYELVIEGAIERGIPRPAYFDTLFKSLRLVRELKGYRIYRSLSAKQ
jgi:4-amino-4-deoxy-L-arabinose transferase-like glycosyltransferase